MERYHGLNLINLANRERMTVEWRIHGGTTDWSKIRPWVLATQRWVEHAVKRSCHFKEEPRCQLAGRLERLAGDNGPQEQQPHRSQGFERSPRSR